MAEVFLRRLTRWQADQQREAIADLYMTAYDDIGDDRQTFVDRFAEDVQRPGFDMLVAGGTPLLGCIYGYPPDREGIWSTGLQGAVPQRVEELTALGQVFTVAELMVHPDHRRTRIATRLQAELLIRVEAELVTTLIDPSNEVARSAYASWGWTKEGTLTPGDGGGDLDVWSRSPH
ncbi:GNAT family N-acetyltransferase [Streptomyces sp. E11-3]|uniref:GNAT family N-acetyltransferase n=1 Tax=Streptomyces sp. E11-3 TaxID=3110112 RepID=UPI00398174A9